MSLVLPVIGGERVSSGGDGVFESIDPATEAVLAEIVQSSTAQVDMAVAAARAAQRVWAAMPAERRSTILWHWGELIVAAGAELAELDSLDIGKPIRDARSDPSVAARAARYWAEHGRADTGRAAAHDTPDTSPTRCANRSASSA